MMMFYMQYIYIFQCSVYLMVISYLSPTNFSQKMREPRCSFRTPFSRIVFNVWWHVLDRTCAFSRGSVFISQHVSCIFIISRRMWCEYLLEIHSGEHKSVRFFGWYHMSSKPCIFLKGHCNFFGTHFLEMSPRDTKRKTQSTP